MESKTLMILSANIFLSGSWKEELQVREDGVYGEVLHLGQRIKMYLPYENIAQVNLVRGVFTAMIEIINKGGSGNLVIKALNKKEAEQAKDLIEQKRAAAQSSHDMGGAAEEIKKLAELRDERIITEEEFQAKKKQLLGL